jgi:hypothetical protein
VIIEIARPKLPVVPLPEDSPTEHTGVGPEHRDSAPNSDIRQHGESLFTPPQSPQLPPTGISRTSSTIGKVQPMDPLRLMAVDPGHSSEQPKSAMSVDGPGALSAPVSHASPMDVDRSPSHGAVSATGSDGWPPRWPMDVDNPDL